jgi:hypothetical protein
VEVVDGGLGSHGQVLQACILRIEHRENREHSEHTARADQSNLAPNDAAIAMGGVEEKDAKKGGDGTKANTQALHNRPCKNRPCTYRARLLRLHAQLQGAYVRQ